MSKNAIFTALFSVFALTGAVTTVSMFNAVPAAAQASDAKAIVDAAKSEGLIGETAGGYLAVIASAPRDVVNAMNEINIRRKSLYTKLARKQNVQIDVVAAVTAEKIKGKASSGDKFLDKDGNWITIP